MDGREGEEPVAADWVPEVVPDWLATICSFRSAQTLTAGDRCGDSADAPRAGEFCASPFGAFGCDAGDEGRVVATTEDAGVCTSVGEDTDVGDLREETRVLPALDVEIVLAADDR